VPHYELTIVRKTPDECKAIVEDGALIAYDLKQDFGISGHYTYAIANPVYSPRPYADMSDYYLPTALKDVVPDFPKAKEVRPEPFEKFTAAQDLFSCLLPVGWKRSSADPEGDAKAGIYEVQLQREGLATPEDGEKYYFPHPLMYVDVRVSAKGEYVLAATSKYGAGNMAFVLLDKQGEVVWREKRSGNLSWEVKAYGWFLFDGSGFEIYDLKSKSFMKRRFPARKR
jgi:hypothetical protein